MLRAELKELKKCYTEKTLCADKVVGVFTDEEKSEMYTITERLANLSEDNLAEYLSLLKKSFSGKPGQTVFTVPVTDDGKKTEMESLRRDLAADRKAMAEIMSVIRDNYADPGKYLTLFSHGAYDIPKKGSDGIASGDSEEVYEFLKIDIVPIVKTKQHLIADRNAETFRIGENNWTAQKPVCSIIYPAFTDRTTDTNAVIYYTAKPDEPHEALVKAFTGNSAPAAAADEKDRFCSIVSSALGANCTAETVRAVAESIREYAEDAEKSEAPAEIGKKALRRIIMNASSSDIDAEAFDSACKECGLSEISTINADTIISRKEDIIESDLVSVKIRSETASAIETKVIGGREFLLIPVSDNMTVNGIAVRQKLN